MATPGACCSGGSALQQRAEAHAVRAAPRRRSVARVDCAPAGCIARAPAPAPHMRARVPGAMCAARQHHRRRRRGGASSRGRPALAMAAHALPHPAAAARRHAGTRRHAARRGRALRVPRGSWRPRKYPRLLVRRRHCSRGAPCCPRASNGGRGAEQPVGPRAWSSRRAGAVRARPAARAAPRARSA
jgi:hypothetical protein